MDIPSYLIGAIKGASSAGVKYVVVQELPTTGEEGTIYLVPKTTSKTNNVYNEYMYINNDWELIGDTQADISGKENTSNKVISINNQSTDTQYPSAKCVYDNLSGKQDIIQYSTMPTATSGMLGKIAQYTGTTTNTYTNGYFYKCINNGGTYSWENINVQSSSGGSSAKYIINVNDDMAGNFTNYNTAANQAVFQDIYDNFDNITADDVCIYGVDSKIYYSVEQLIYYYGYLRVRTSYIDVGVSSTYGVYYHVMKQNDIYTPITNDNVGTISTLVNTAYMLDAFDTNYLVLGLSNNQAYTPTGDYNPATKKYVDDAIGTALNSSY